MNEIKQVILYEVDGNSFKSWEEAENYLRDKFGEEINELIKMHFPTYAHRQATIDFVLKMWKNRDEWVRLLSVHRDPHPDVCEEDDEIL